MTDVEWHVASVVPVAFLAVLLGHHPFVAVPLVLGVLLPELDASRESLHRSWVLHTFLAPALVYFALGTTGHLETIPWLVTTLNFVTIGIAFHLFADFVYPREMSHQGAEWPVRPTIGSAPWGLIWMGVSWLVQWYVYLVPEFIPWLVGL